MTNLKKLSKWVNAKARLPRIKDTSRHGDHHHLQFYAESVPVLGFIKNEGIYIGRFVNILRDKTDSKYEQYFATEHGDFAIEEITHWQHMPDAPKKKD